MDVEISKDDLLKMLQATGKENFTLKEFRQFVLDKWLQQVITEKVLIFQWYFLRFFRSFLKLLLPITSKSRIIQAKTKTTKIIKYQ